MPSECSSPRRLLVLTALSQDETSEAFIGEWMEERKNRDQMVIATKVCFSMVV